MKTNKNGLAVVDREELDSILKNWLKKPKKAGDRTKGILIAGLPGIGKSTALTKICNNNHPYSTVQDYVKWMNGKKQDTVQNFYWENYLMALDEIGSKRINYYGEDPIIDYILNLYQKWSSGKTDHNIVFLSTTNLNLDQLQDLYGERVLDRLKEMCYIIVLEDTKIRPGLESNNVNDLLCKN